MAGRVAPPAADGYPAAFRALVVSSAHAMLRLAQQADPVLADGDREQVLHVLGYALALPEAWPVTRDLLLCLAPQMEQAGLREEWAPFLRKGIDLCLVAADVPTLAELRLHLGILFRSLGRWDEASALLELSVADFASLDNNDGQARALNRLAYLERLRGNHATANTIINQAFELCVENSETEALCHTTMGAIALDTRAWQNAEFHFQKALALWKRYNNRRLIAWSLGDLGVALWRQKQFMEAAETFNRAITIFKEAQDPIQLAATRMNLGLVYRALSKPKDALEQFAQAETVFLRVNDQLRLAMLYNNRGNTFQDLDRWKEAEQAYLLSLSCWRHLGDSYSEANVMDSLGTVYLKQGQKTAAIQIFQKAIDKVHSIQDVPDHGHLLRLLTTHLQDALNA